MCRLSFFTLGFLLFFTNTALSSGMPTYDFFNHVEQLFQTAEQKLIAANSRINNVYAVRRIRNQLKQLDQARKRLAILERQHAALSGKHGYGRWLKGPARLATRDYRPESTEELERLLRQGDSRSAYKKDRDAWVNIYLPTDPKKGRIESGDTPKTAQQRALIDSSGSLEIMGRQLYNDTVARAQTINDLLTRVDETDNVKQSVDLLNTNIAELHRTMEKLLTLQSLMARRASAVDTGKINENKNNQEFMQW